MTQDLKRHSSEPVQKPEGSVGSIAVLGFCDRAEVKAPRGDIFPIVSIVNLRGADLFPLFPMQLRGLSLVLSVHKTTPEGTFEIGMESEQDGIQVFKVSLDIKHYRHSTGYQGTPRFIRDWEIIPFEFPQGAMIITPGPFRVTITKDGSKREIGTVRFLFGEIPSLTPSQVNAIRSNPLSSKTVRMGMGCSSCGTELRLYVALEGRLKEGIEDFSWYEDIPERFTCGCGAFSFDTFALRKNFHYLLLFDRASAARIKDLQFTRLYDESAIEHTVRQFFSLLDSATCEEDIQSFIKSNKMLLAQFSPREVLVKPPLLNKYRADFGIVNQRGELLLIELERANCKLMKRNGGVHSELQKALDQTRSWKSIVEDHRSSVLQMMGLESHNISRVRMVVVAGRRQKYRVQDLRTLIGAGLGDADFYTYDDLVEAVLTQTRLLAEL